MSLLPKVDSQASEQKLLRQNREILHAAGSMEDDSDDLGVEQKCFDTPKRSFLIAGFLLGWIVQFAVLEATVWVTLRSRESTSSMSLTESIQFNGTWILCIISFAAWPVIAIGPCILSMTDMGSKLVEPLFAGTESPPSRRSLFLTGVCYFVGISVGNFAANVMANTKHGYPFSMARMASSLMACLVLCYMMIITYDREHQDEEEDDEQNSSYVRLETGVPLAV